MVVLFNDCIIKQKIPFEETFTLFTNDENFLVKTLRQFIIISIMKTVKVYCDHCKNSSDKERIFVVNNNSINATCPTCGHGIEIVKGMTSYENHFNKLLKKSADKLNNESDFANAYKAYANILDLDENNVEAIFGRLISLLKMSTVRDSKIEDVTLMLEQASRKVHVQQAMVGTHSDFLLRIKNVLKLYLRKVHGRLTVKNYFYDGECLRLYLDRTDEAIILLNLVSKEFENLKNRFPNSIEIQSRIISINEYILELKHNFLGKYRLVDGGCIIVSKTPSNELVLAREEKAGEPLKTFNLRKMSLYFSNREFKYIKDVIFPRRIHLYRFNKAALYYSLTATTISIVFLILSFFSPHKIYFLITAGALAIVAIILLIAKLITNKRFIR